MEEQTVGPDLVLSVDRTDAGAVVAVTGELDAYSSPQLETQINRLTAESVQEVVLDWSGTRFLDSSGLRAILSAQQSLQEREGRLRLRRPSEAVSRLLEITGLDDHFTVEGSER
jgi:anti-sigma B factor antagonist